MADPRSALPKIPLFGPAAQLGPEVLVSRLGELGHAATARETLKRPQPGKLSGSTPWSAREPSRGVCLPSIEPSSAGTSKCCSTTSLLLGGGVASLCSARSGPVGSDISGGGGSKRPFVADAAPVSNNGLAAHLYKTDHTHRFHGVFAEERQEHDARGGEEPLQLGDIMPGSIAGGLTHTVHTAPPVPFKPVGAFTASSTAGNGSRRTRKAAKVPTIPESEAPVRQARVRASFRHEAAEIEAAITSLYTWPSPKQLEPKDSVQPEDIDELRSAFDRTGLEATNVRKHLLTHDEDLLADVEHEEDPYGHAFPREIASCVSVLNFVRWLCGLKPVQLAREKLQATDIISQALLPRAPVMPTPQLQKDMVRFAAVIQEFVEQQNNRLSILHGEGSLIGAIEQSLMATHCLRGTEGGGAGQDGAAKALAARAAADPRSRDLVPRQRGGAAAAAAAATAAQRELFAKLGDLPPALQELGVFWDMRPPTGVHIEAPTLSPRRASTLSPRRASQLLSRQASQALEPPPMCTPRRPDPRRGPPEVVDPDGGLYGLSAVWGDRDGALAFRRCLLNPKLREFGASRRHDTCVFWTGAASAAEGSKTARGFETPDAVCYPPSGYIPLVLLRYGKVPWTIAPDSTRFQPTAETRVRMWRVRMDRPSDRDWTVERCAELPIKAFTVDCCTKGEPFCVIFWPDVAQYSNGDQFEVELSGLRGPVSDLAFFYDIRSFTQRTLDNSLFTEATRIRSTFGGKSLWGEPLLRTFEPKPPEPSKASQQATQASQASRRRSSISGMQMSPRRSIADRRSSAMRRISNPVIVTPGPAAIEMLSHHTTAIVTHVPDVSILLRCQTAAAISSTLYLTHFGGEEEEVPFAVQVHKLAGQHFLFLVKLPMGRRHYELRLRVSTLDAPEDMQPHPLSYNITTTDQCPSLLASLEDSNASKFGYSPISPVAHSHGVVVLAPHKRRVLIGQCYFLVYVDKAKALEAAHAHLSTQCAGTAVKSPTSATGRSSAEPGLPSPMGSPQAADRGARVAPAAGAEAAVAAGGPALFSDRLLSRGRSSGPIGDLHKALCSTLSPHTQDGGGEVHLDIAIHNGECVQRLQERHDMPGLFEGLVTLSGVDATHVVKLALRFPRIHAVEYNPRVISEWLTCRLSENLPSYF